MTTATSTDSKNRFILKARNLFKLLDENGLELIYVCSGTSTAAYIREQGVNDNDFGVKVASTKSDDFGLAIGGQICP